MEKIYVPILKYRPVEMAALKNLINCDGFHNNSVIPLIEIIQLKTRSNSKNEFDEDIDSLLKDSKMKIFVDIVKETPGKSMTRSVSEFLYESSRDEDFVFAAMSRFEEHNESIVPIISTNKKAPDEVRYLRDANRLRAKFRRLGFRVELREWDFLSAVLDVVVEANDYLLFDIGNTEPTHPILREQYFKVSEFCQSKQADFIIINDPRPKDLRNKDLENGKPIYEINNVLLDIFDQSMMRAQGFGDYGGITSSYPSTGGAISPAAVFYSVYNNLFVGFRGETTALHEFDNIAKDIIDSDCWQGYGQNHQKNCPGCKEIYKFATEEGGHSQSVWKRITMEHYIYSVAETIAER